MTAVALVAALGACHKKGSDASKYETVQVSRGTLTAKVTASGALSALVTVTVGSQVSGRIDKLYVDYNTKVKKGQLLAQIDPQLFQATVDQQEANVAQAKAQVASAVATQELNQLNFDRQTKLFALKLSDKADFDSAKANLDVAKAAVLNARANLQQQEALLRQARTSLTYTKIVSPIDGVVISRAVDVGQTVASAFQSPTLFTIAQDLQKMQVDTNVAESDIGKLQPGVPASFAVDAYPGEHFKGRIRQIRDAPQTVQNVVTYDVVIDVDNLDLKLLPGMTANAEFVTARKENVLKVSNAALRFHPTPDMLPAGDHHKPTEEGKPKEPRPTDRKNVWVLREGSPVRVAVQTGLTDGHETEVTSTDLNEGDTVITGASADATAKAHASRGPF